MNSVYTRYGSIPCNELHFHAIPVFPKVSHNWKNKELLINGIDNCCNPNIKCMTKGNTISFFDAMANKGNVYFRAGSSNHSVILPRYLNPKLAYLLGYMYGDGALKDIFKTYKNNGKYEHSILVCDEFELQISQVIQPLFKELFNLHTNLYSFKNKRLYYVRPTCKIVYRFLSQILSFPIGFKNEISVPNFILDAPPQIRKWFISGVFDSDGDTKIMENRTKDNLPNFRIKLKMKSKPFILQMQKLVYDDFGINLTGPYTDEGKYWYIQGAKKCSIDANNRKLFIHPIKEWRLRKICEMGS